MSDRRRLLGNMASLFTLQGANYILPLVTLPYLVRVLGPEKFGLIAFSQAFMQYFIVATDYGFNLSATRDIAVHRGNADKLGAIVSSVLTIKLLLAVLGFGALMALLWLVPTFHQHWPLYLVVYLSVLGATLFPTWLFQGLERMRDITWMNVGARLVTTSAIFVYIRRPNDYVLAAAIQSAPVLLAALPAWWTLKRVQRIKIQVPSIGLLRQQLVAGWHVFLSTAAINVYTSSNTFVLGLIAGPVAVGYFSAANKIVQAAQGLLTPVSQAIYPHISALRTQSQEQALRFIRNILRYLAAGSLLVSLVVLFGAPWLVQLILGAQYVAAVSILRWLALLPFIIALSNVYGIQTMLTFGMNKIFSRILLASAALNMILIIPLASIFQGNGAAMSMLFTEIFVTATMAIVLERKGIHLHRFRPEAA